MESSAPRVKTKFEAAKCSWSELSAGGDMNTLQNALGLFHAVRA